jgi:aconitate hydratase
VAAAVLSGNRNFEGRIHAYVRANYLASPPLVVAYALAGTVDIDLVNEPLGHNSDGEAIYLRDIWPTKQEIQTTLAKALQPEMFTDKYANVFSGNPTWNAIEAGESDIYVWDPDSTYIQEPPFFLDLKPELSPIADIKAARSLVVVGDSITTDHISPAGAFAADTPAGKYLIEKGVSPRDFNSYGSRRGNDRVMTRGTFANIRLKNLLIPGVEGGYTRHLPDGEKMSIYKAAQKYNQEGVPLIVLAGKEYGTGSSRDWAAKGTLLLGVKAVIAESFERIHRSNLVGMGVLPLQFKAGEGLDELELSGEELFFIEGLSFDIKPGSEVTVRAVKDDGSQVEFQVVVRLDTQVEVTYYRNGGILHTVLRNMLSSE